MKKYESRRLFQYSLFNKKRNEFIIDIDKSNVDMLNNLHVEKIINEDIYSKLVRKNKKWI